MEAWPGQAGDLAVLRLLAPPAPAPAPAPAPGLRVTHGYPPQASVAAQPQALQLVQGPDGNFVLQTNPAVLQTNPAAPPAAEGGAGAGIFSPAPAPAASAALSPAPAMNTLKSSPKPLQRPRNIADINRTPLFEDEVSV